MPFFVSLGQQRLQSVNDCYVLNELRNELAQTSMRVSSGKSSHGRQPRRLQCRIGSDFRMYNFRMDFFAVNRRFFLTFLSSCCRSATKYVHRTRRYSLAKRLCRNCVQVGITCTSTALPLTGLRATTSARPVTGQAAIHRRCDSSRRRVDVARVRWAGPMRALKIPVGRILASPYCRTVATAKLMNLGRVETTTDIVNLRVAAYFGGRDAIAKRAQAQLATPHR